MSELSTPLKLRRILPLTSVELGFHPINLKKQIDPIKMQDYDWGGHHNFSPTNRVKIERLEPSYPPTSF